MPEARGSDPEEPPETEVRGGSWEEPPTPEARASSQEEHPEGWWSPARLRPVRSPSLPVSPASA